MFYELNHYRHGRLEREQMLTSTDEEEVGLFGSVPFASLWLDMNGKRASYFVWRR